MVGWSELLADVLGRRREPEGSAGLLKTMAKKTLEYVNWLTHFKKPCIRTPKSAWPPSSTSYRPSPRHACARSSYAMAPGSCRRCGWEDPTHEPPEHTAMSEEERAARPAAPCIPSSDIATFITPEDFRRA